MAKMKCFILFIFLMSSISGYADGPIADPSTFSGVWLESYPGQQYDPIRSGYITIQRIGNQFLLINTSTRRPGGAGVLQWDGQYLVSSSDNEVIYRISEDDHDVLFAEFSAQEMEGPRIIRFIRYSEHELNVLKETLQR
jgi:hypothetical protein